MANKTTSHKPQKHGSDISSPGLAEDSQDLRSVLMVQSTAMSSRDLLVTSILFLEQLTNVFDVDAAAFWLYKKETNSLDLVCWRGIETPPHPAAIYSPLNGLPGKVLQSDTPIHHSPLPDESAFSRPEIILGKHYQSYFAIRLDYNSDVLGIIELFNRDSAVQKEPWKTRVTDFCQQCSMALGIIEHHNKANHHNHCLKQALEDILISYANTLDLYEHKKTGHSIGLAQTATHLARILGLSQKEILTIKRGALLHDLGNITIPDKIFLKPGPLNDTEWALIQQHTLTGCEFLKDIDFLRPSLDLLKSHHEKWDGTGYPKKLQGEEIPFFARIFSVADTWESLRADRPYRPAFSWDDSLEMIARLSGTAFDPKITKAFLSNPPADHPSPMIKKPLLLVVDDETNVTQTLARSLRNDFDVFTANSAEEALKLVELRHFQIVLTDQRMPGKTGIDLLRQIRKTRPETIGLLISAYLDSNVLAEAINLGNVVGFIGKPWDQTELNLRLKTAAKLM